jgi:protein Hikeshi
MATVITASLPAGVSAEPLQGLLAKESSKMGAREDFAKRVAFNLFQFMQSFSSRAANDQLVVPGNVIDRWFTRFQEKFRKDPDFLARQEMPV